MKLTITNNGTEPFSVSYTDMYKLYNEDEYAGETVVLQPDTSITLDNVERIHEIQPVPEGGDDDDFSLESLKLDDDDSDDDLLDTSDSDEDQGNTLSQEDFDIIEREADKPT